LTRQLNTSTWEVLMEYMDGYVNKSIHVLAYRWQQPGGLMVNIHKQTETSWVQICLEPLGQRFSFNCSTSTPRCFLRKTNIHSFIILNPTWMTYLVSLTVSIGWVVGTTAGFGGTIRIWSCDEELSTYNDNMTIFTVFTILVKI